jgi:hypothetical protein
LKKIISVSLGSTARDHATRINFLGQECELSRQGTNGDLDKAVALYEQLDGKVDAFGVGGIEFALHVGRRVYYFRDAKRIRKAIKVSKVGDGNGVKGLLEQRAFQALEKKLNETGETLKGMKALHTTAVDRYSMAEAMVSAGCTSTFGDFMFALGLPFELHHLTTVRIMAAILLPVITQVPYKWLYPLGAEQDKEPKARWSKVFEDNQLICGDFIQIRQNMLSDMSGKIIVTNTTTAKNVEELQKRGVRMLVTATPRLEGRSFGTNVMEATMLSLMDKPQSQVTQADFIDLIERIPIRPSVEVLN